MEVRPRTYKQAFWQKQTLFAGAGEFDMNDRWWCVIDSDQLGYSCENMIPVQ